MRTAIVIIATGRYNSFVPKLMSSIENFWPDLADVFLFTDSRLSSPRWFPAENKPWPFVTLTRFETLRPIYPHLKDYDYVLYLDADMEIMSSDFPFDGMPDGKKFVSVSHPANYFDKSFWPVETNPRSLAFIDGPKSEYRQGCLWGASAAHFEHMNESLARSVSDDLKQNIVAVWHDESHLNKFFYDNQDDVFTLDSSYAYPENWSMVLPKRIIHKDKNMVDYPRFSGNIFRCRITGEECREIFSLGDLYVSDFVKEQSADSPHEEMKLMFSESTGLVQLEKKVDKHKMYGNYWYRSGTNETMRKQLKNVVDSCLYLKKLGRDSLWLDIACNDGTLLSYIPDHVSRLGIDPVEDSYKKESSKYADQIIQDFFSKEVYDNSIYGNRKCDVVTCIAMFYDLDDPSSFLQDVHSVLKDDGLFIVQMSYTPLMVEQLAFDNICHEHLMYYTLKSFKHLAEMNEFKIVDCELNDVNGGSFRIYLQKENAPPKSFANAPYRDVAKFRIESILNYEPNTFEHYLEFFERVKELKDSVRKFIIDEKAKGKVTWIIGASTKGNTLLQYFGLDSSLIGGAAERSPYKIGLKTVGTDIPIFSEEHMRSVKPDYLLVLPWHFIDELRDRESDYLNSGGKFIVPCPKLEIVGA